METLPQEEDSSGGWLVPDLVDPRLPGAVQDDAHISQNWIMQGWFLVVSLSPSCSTCTLFFSSLQERIIQCGMGADEEPGDKG